MISVWGLESETASISSSPLLLRCHSPLLPLYTLDSNSCHVFPVIIKSSSQLLVSQQTLAELADTLDKISPQYSAQLSTFPLSPRY